MSTRITNSMITRSLLYDLNQVAERLSHTQRKLSSGRELTRPSDDPFAVSRAIALRGSLEATRQHSRNAGEAISWNTVTDVALGRMGDAVQRARELLVQGSNDALGQAGRVQIAAEIDSLIETLKQEANASYGGRHVFAGTLTDTQPYAVGGADAYAGNGDPIVREIGPGVSVQVNVLGSAVLGSGQGAADDRLLHVLRDIADHLRGGTAADRDALRGTDLQRLDANLAEISRQRAFVGATTRRLETARDRLAEIEESSLKLLSETEDADMAKTIVEFSTQQSVYQSALKAGANIVQASLLDFLR